MYFLEEDVLKFNKIEYSTKIDRYKWSYLYTSYLSIIAQNPDYIFKHESSDPKNIHKFMKWSCAEKGIVQLF